MSCRVGGKGLVRVKCRGGGVGCETGICLMTCFPPPVDSSMAALACGVITLGAGIVSEQTRQKEVSETYNVVFQALNTLANAKRNMHYPRAVSYTHLTLPTKA